MKKVIDFFKKETVLSVAMILAVLSCFFVVPDKQYLNYIDFRTLSILFCLMCIMAGLQDLSLFKWTAEGMLKNVKSLRALSLILVMLCFVLSMFITNDVALITFVPFTYTVLKMLGQEKVRKYGVTIVIFQTIAANMGSMLTPIGNPQNLYLYGKSQVGLFEFIMWLLPYTLICLAFLLGAIFLMGGKKDEKLEVEFKETSSLSGKGIKIGVYAVLFVLSLLTVARIFEYWVVLIIVLAVLLVMDRRIIGKVDYSLLLTFVGFFIFIGNAGRMDFIREFLEKIVTGHEVVTSVIASQAISNVPAALMLSEFTDNYKALTIGVSFGGLGTLIASMANLISYKVVARETPDLKGRYLMKFTIWCLALLAILMAVYELGAFLA